VLVFEDLQEIELALTHPALEAVVVDRPADGLDRRSVLERKCRRNRVAAAGDGACVAHPSKSSSWRSGSVPK
jgi:hypothetical protein